ncbi:MAG: CRTAC1 family protein [Planctomycetes bacterium]|nr:CRTAC1 family protein [Planctomycetota bacterium]
MKRYSQLENDWDSTEPDDDEERDDAAIGSALRWSLTVFAVLGLTIGTVIWWLNRPSGASLTTARELRVAKVRAVPTSRVPDVPFTDVTEESGILFVHENGAYGDKLLPETMGGGCAFLDYDNDGDQDLLLVNSKRWAWDVRPPAPPTTAALYRNDGTGRFTDVTEESGLAVSLYGMGAAVGDYDNDGLVDVFISALGKDRLFKNTGRGVFEDVTEAAGVAGRDEDWSSSAGWLDYDNDGDLDLVVCSYVRWSKDYDLAQDFQLTGGGRAYGRPQDFEGSFSKLYRNEDGKRFTDVSAEAGIEVRNPLTEMPMGKSLGATFIDFDQDGWLDIVVANDTVQNFLLHNQRDGTFDEIGMYAGVAFDMAGAARGAMGIDVAHFRNNDAVGIAIGNFANEASALYVCNGPTLRFVDEAIPTGLGPSTRKALTFGVFYFDFDLDGRLDLLAANGHLEADINRVQPSQHYAQPPQLFWNAGPEHGTEFCAMNSKQCGPDLFRPMVGRGAAFADIDNDGDQDVLITACGQTPRLLRNDQRTDHHWLRIRLRGSTVNHDAIGASVEIRMEGRRLRQQVMPTRSYLSQVELPVTFGLGRFGEVQSVRITWPDGSVQDVEPPSVDQMITIQQESAGEGPRRMDET